MSILQRIRPQLRELSPYSAAEQVEETIRLNANESPFTAPNDHFRRPLNRYPQIRPVDLRTAMASRFGSRPEELLVTRGSSEAIDLLIRCFCNADRDSIIVSSPTFSMYTHYATIQGAGCLDVPLKTGFELPVDAICSAIDQSIKLIFICSPNNPTGTSVPAKQIEAVLDAAKDTAAVVVDEAYIEFSGNASLVQRIQEYSNLVVLRTLSKALGYAGARCGAVIAQSEIIRVMDAVQAPYALSTPVAESVEEALSADVIAACEDNVERLIAERTRMQDALESLPSVLEVVPSDANFLLVRFQDAQRVMEATRSSRILLRFFGGDLNNCIRISIGSEIENTALLNVLGSLESSA